MNTEIIICELYSVLCLLYEVDILNIYYRTLILPNYYLVRMYTNVY